LCKKFQAADRQGSKADIQSVTMHKAVWSLCVLEAAAAFHTPTSVGIPSGLRLRSHAAKPAIVMQSGLARSVPSCDPARWRMMHLHADTSTGVLSRTRQNCKSTRTCTNHKHVCYSTFSEGYASQTRSCLISISKQRTKVYTHTKGSHKKNLCANRQLRWTGAACWQQQVDLR